MKLNKGLEVLGIMYRLEYFTEENEKREKIFTTEKALEEFIDHITIVGGLPAIVERFTRT